MKAYVLSLIISLSTVFTHADPAFYRPSVSEFQETKKISLQIANEYQEDTHEIVGIGRSVNIIVAFLKNLGLRNVSVLPLSEMNTFEKVDDINKYRKLFSYFDSLIPFQKNKKLVFFDFSVGGKSYLAQKVAIEAYMKAYHPKVKYEFVALVTEVNDKLITTFNTQSVKIIKLKSKAEHPYGALLGDQLYNEVYDSYSQYGKFRPWQDNALTPNPQFEEFKELVRREMMKDQDLFCPFLF